MRQFSNNINTFLPTPLNNKPEIFEKFYNLSAIKISTKNIRITSKCN